MKVLINQIIDATNAISHADGLEVYNHVKALGSNKIILSFDGINRVSTAFLNASIGKMILDKSYRDEFIDKSNTKEIILKKIESVKTNAKNHIMYDKIVDDATALC